jgi:hypothetical protein
MDPCVRCARFRTSISHWHFLRPLTDTIVPYIYISIYYLRAAAPAADPGIND